MKFLYSYRWGFFSHFLSINLLLLSQLINLGLNSVGILRLGSLHSLKLLLNGFSQFLLLLLGQESEVSSVGTTNSIPNCEERTIVANILGVMIVVIVGRA